MPNVENRLALRVEAVAQGVAATLKQIENQVKKLADGVDRSGKKADQSMRNLGKAIAEAAKLAQRNVDRSFRALEARGNALAANFQSTMGRINTAINTTVALIGTALVGAAGAGFREVNKFNDALTEISTLGASLDDLETYRDGLIGIADTTSESLVDLTKGLYQTISSGAAEGAVAVGLLDIAQKSAIAGLTDTATAVDALTVTLNTFGSELTTDADKLAFVESSADKLNKVVDLGRTKFEDLARNIGRVSGVAASVGVSLDEVGASLAILTRVFPNTEQATNALTQALLKLSAPGAKAKETAEELGIEIGEAAIKAKGFPAVLAEIIEKTDGSVEALKPLLEDTLAVRAVASIAAVGMGEFDEALTAVAGSAGSVASDVDAMSDTIGFRFGRLRNLFVNTLIPLFEKEFGPVVKSTLDDVASFVEENGEEIAETVGTIFRAFSGFVSFLVRNRSVILSILAAIFAKKVLDLFTGGLLAVTKGIGDVRNAFAVMSKSGADNIARVAGSVDNVNAKASQLAGAVGLVGAAFVALAPIVIAAVDQIVTELNRAENVAKEVGERTLEAIEGTRDRIFTGRRETFAELRALAEEDERAAVEAASERLRIETETLEAIPARKKKINEELERLEKERIDAVARASASITGESIAEAKDRFDAMEVELRANLAAEETRARLIKDTVLGLNEFIRDTVKDTGKVRDDTLRTSSGVFVFESDKIVGKAEETSKAVRDKWKRRMKELREAFEELFGGGIEEAFGGAFDFFRSETERLSEPVQRLADLVRDIAALRGEDVGLADALIESAGALIEASEAAEGIDIEDLVGGFEDAGAALRSVMDDPELASVLRDRVAEGAEEGGTQVEEGLEKGAEQAAPTLGRKIGAALGDAALSFGRTLGEIGANVGNFFADFFIRGPLDELQNLIKLATSTDPEEFGAQLEEKLEGFISTIENLVDNLPVLISSLVEFLPRIAKTLLDAVPEIIDSLLEGLPDLIQGLIDAIPDLTTNLAQSLADNIEPLIAKLEEEMPRLGEAIAGGIRDSIETFSQSDFLPRIVNILLDLVGQILTALIDGISDTLSGLLRDLPDIILGIVDLIVSDLIPAIIAEIPEILGALVEGLPDFIQELVGGLVSLLDEAIPGIVDSIIGQDGLISKIPELIGELLMGISEIIGPLVSQLMTSVVGMIPDLIGSFIEGMPDILSAFVELLIIKMPEIVFELVKGLIEGLASFFSDLFSIGGGRREERLAAIENQTPEEALEAQQRQAAAIQQLQEQLAAQAGARLGGLVTPSGVQRLQIGGIVQALQSSVQAAMDRVPALLEPGEFVMNRAATQSIGQGNLNQANRTGRMPSGGGGVTLQIMPGASMMVDSRRAVDSIVDELLGRGVGRTAQRLRANRGAPIRGPQDFAKEN